MSRSAPCRSRYEVLPFRSSLEQAAGIGTPLRLTLTASAKHGIDRSVGYAEKLRALGHDVTLHLAARMVRDREHLDAILARTSAAGIDDLFVVGGDVPEPIGAYGSAGELLDVLANHALRPAALGIAAYPEGHPLIERRELEQALARKAQHATYMVTQMCFDPGVLLAWLAQQRAQGIALPLYAGATGHVDRRRLLEISVRIGVGPSLRFLRKQRGVARLFRGAGDTAERFQDELAAHLGDPELGIAGFHLFTFNELTATWRRQQERCGSDDRAAAGGAT